MICATRKTRWDGCAASFETLIVWKGFSTSVAIRYICILWWVLRLLVEAAAADVLIETREVVPLVVVSSASSTLTHRTGFCPEGLEIGLQKSQLAIWGVTEN